MAVALLRLVLPMEIPTGLGFSEGIREGGLKGKVSGPNYDSIQRKKPRWSLYSLYTDSKYACAGFEPENNGSFRIRSSLFANPAGEVAVSAEQKVYDVVLKQAALVEDQRRSRTTSIDVKPDMAVPGTLYLLRDAYDRCGKVCAEYAKTFYLGTLLMTPERRRAIWAIYVWCRRTDELVDGPNASHITPSALDRWEARLEDLFAGHPYDMFDAALSDTVSRFPVDIQICRTLIHLIEGRRPANRASRGCSGCGRIDDAVRGSPASSLPAGVQSVGSSYAREAQPPWMSQWESIRFPTEMIRCLKDAYLNSVSFSEELQAARQVCGEEVPTGLPPARASTAMES